MATVTVPRWGLYINGRWREGSRYVPVLHKYRQEVMAEVAEADEALVDEAVRAAQGALEERPLSPYRRFEILRRAADLLSQRREEFALTIAREAGKPLKYARVEVDRAIQTISLSGEEAKRIHGEQVPVDAAPGAEGRLAFTLRVPVGVVCAISPFNFPLNLVAHKVAPALAAGNAVVLKPATYTPLTSLMLAQLLEEAGLPPGYLNVVVGGGRTVGEALLRHPGIALYTFTGSPEVGERVKAATGLRRVILELGNNSPNLVARDANLDQAAQLLARFAYLYAGQFCISVQRIYVERPAYEPFLEKFVAAARAMKLGDPEEPDTDIGPLISEDDARRVEAWVEEAVQGGARRVLGGPRQGVLYPATVLTDVRPEMKVVCQEVFGPVASVVACSSFEEAIQQANDTEYGLQAGVFTRSLDRAVQAARSLRMGGVIVNDTSGFRVDLMPYGGVRRSGIGREGPRYAIEEMTDLRIVVLNAADGW